ALPSPAPAPPPPPPPPRAGVPDDRARAAVDMGAAVALAERVAAAGSAVLLSPAAPSYHAYANFEARGDHFRELVSRL
ncbi:MAG: hypothetical protein ACR2KV_02675, partial [Solirubrobacteraceae bacterium]